MKQIVFTNEQIEQIKDFYINHEMGLDKVGSIFKCGRRPIERVLKLYGIPIKKDSYKKIPINDRYFQFIDSPEKAYWLGILTTDGNISETRICINLIDKEHLQKFATALGCPDFPLKKHQKKTKDKSYIIWRLQFRSKAMVEDLAKLNIIPNKTWTVTAWDGPSELMSHFWRGCIDGDGAIGYINGYNDRFYIELCGNKNITSQFSNFISNILEKTIKLKKYKSIFVCRISVIEDVRKICKILYKENCTSLNRKRDLANQAIIMPPQRKPPGRPRQLSVHVD